MISFFGLMTGCGLFFAVIGLKARNAPSDSVPVGTDRLALPGVVAALIGTVGFLCVEFLK